MTFRDVKNQLYLTVFFVFAMVEVLVCSGITYGWASIVYVFKVEYFYMSLCRDASGNGHHPNNGTLHSASAAANVSSVASNDGFLVGAEGSLVGEDGLPGCLAQDSMFNLIFTVAVFFFTSVQFPTGLFIDKFGPRVARYVGGVAYVLSCVALGFVRIGYEWLLFPVFAVLCVAGGVLSMSVYQASNIIYREHRSKVICILHGAFDSSAVMLLIFKVIYDHGISYERIMIGYAIFCFLLNTFGTFVMIPVKKVLFSWSKAEKMAVVRDQVTSMSDDYQVEFMHKSLDASYNMSNKQPAKIYIPPTYNTVEDQLGMDNNKVTKSSFQNEEHHQTVNKNEEHEEEEDVFQTDDGDELPLVESSNMAAEESIWKSISSPLYLFELLYVCTFQLKLWYMVGALAEDLVRLTNNDKALVSKYIDIFGYVQFGGIFVTPLIGLLFDKSSFGKEKKKLITSPEREHIRKLSECILPFVLTGSLCIVLCIVSAIQNLKLQVLSFILYMIVRGFLYSSHGAYVGAAFPASQFGTLYGFGIFIAGLFGTLQYGLFQFKSGPLHGDPLVVNVILLVLVLIGNFHPIYLWWHCRRETKKLN